MDFQGRLRRDPILGDEWIPIVPVVLRNAEFMIPVRMLVDSGAHITLIPFSAGFALGLEMSDEEVLAGDAVGGSNVPYRLRTITIEIASHEVTARIGWLFDDRTVRIKSLLVATLTPPLSRLRGMVDATRREGGRGSARLPFSLSRPSSPS